jgi:hypothetical protein
VTRASGRSRSVVCRKVTNQRLAETGFIWAFSNLVASPGCRAHYDRRRAAGDRHNAAQRNLSTRLIRIMHHCLSTNATFDEARAFRPHRSRRPLPEHIGGRQCSDRARSELLAAIPYILSHLPPVRSDAITR